MTWDERLATIKAMDAYGGSFVRALANAWKFADDSNSAKIEAAFPEYVARYLEIAEQKQQENDNEAL